MSTSNILTATSTFSLDAFLLQLKNKSDKMANYFLAAYFSFGLFLAAHYDTWLIAFGIGGLSVTAYYSAKFLLPESNVYQYVFSTVLGLFMAQFIYQMHGMFEMHFVAFIGSAVLITYQNWKLQIPILLVVVIHHGVFGYMQFIGYEEFYFTELNYMDLQTFIIHIILAAVIFYICGLWAYHFRQNSQKQIDLSNEIGKIQEEENTKLQKVNSELDKFVYSVSHDLRAPLSSMKGVIELSEDETDDPAILKHFELLKGSVNKLDDFIQDILNYSMNARLDIKKQHIDLKEMLEDITNNLKHMSSNSKSPVDITFEIDATKPFISDNTRISILLSNLISNAIRYQDPAKSNPSVDITINVTDAETGIRIKDNGVGISKEYHQKIFDMFYRVSENSVGSGLGLYIVKETIEKLNGKIHLESELGIGTTFNIFIPNN